MEQYGTGKFIINDPTEEDRKQARIGFKHCKSVLSSGYFDLVVLDEIIMSVFLPADNYRRDFIHAQIQKTLGGSSSHRKKGTT